MTMMETIGENHERVLYRDSAKDILIHERNGGILFTDSTFDMLLVDKEDLNAIIKALQKYMDD